VKSSDKNKSENKTDQLHHTYK